MFKRNQAVIVTHAAGQSETGRIVRADRQLKDWYIVRLDADGGKLCIAASSLQDLTAAIWKQAEEMCIPGFMTPLWRQHYAS